MAMTVQVKQELAEVRVARLATRQVEAISLIRFAGKEVTTDRGPRIVLEFDTDAAARRAATLVGEATGVTVTVSSFPSSGSTTVGRFICDIDMDKDRLLRVTELVTRSGAPIVGLPPRIVSGSISDAEAVWRGAFLAHGSLTEPGRSASLEIMCPCPEAALALVGCARRIGISTVAKELRGHDRVLVKDSEDIGALLTRLGAQRTRLRWEDKRLRREVRGSASRLANFDDANLRRSVKAAANAAARAERALKILGDDVPDHLAEAGHLRVQHLHASLEELGRLADPQLTKDAIAGRIRRLCSQADKRAAELGIPDTTAAVSDDLIAAAEAAIQAEAEGNNKA